MIKAVLFDLDGTLGDTIPICIESFKQTMRSLAGREMSDIEIVSHFGPTEEGMLRKLLPDKAEAGLQMYLDHYSRLHDTCGAPFPGIMELLVYLRRKGMLLAVVTGKGEHSARISLGRYGLGSFFDEVETGSPDGAMKDIYIGKILAKHRLSREEAVYIGDSPYDLRDARKAGIFAFSAAWATTVDRAALEQAGPDMLFDTVGDFGDYLRGILGE